MKVVPQCAVIGANLVDIKGLTLRFRSGTTLSNFT